jgi:tetratricopeptide (TPR) repeat protein
MLRARTPLLCGIPIVCVAFATQSGAGAAPPPTGVSDSEYTELIGQYRRGDFEGAMGSLVKWPADRVRAVTRGRAPLPNLGIRQAEAAVMLHSDVAMLVAVVEPRLSREHVDAARAWVRILPNDAAARFKERWQTYAVGPSLVQHNLASAAIAMRQGFGAFPGSADLQLMRGTVLELTAWAQTSDIRGRRTLNSRMETDLREAAVAYQRALELDPALLSARLRLGWVYDVDNSAGHAREELRIVTERATSPDLLYLARLILGGIDEQEGRADLAYEEYDRAHTIQPEGQSAHIALMRAARMTGRVDRAEALFAEYTARTSVGEDPWWDFSLGLDSELAGWLHAQVTQP